jgi:hypothetical protein
MKVSHLGSRFVELSQAWCDGPHAGTIAFDNERGEVVLLQHPYGPRGYARFEAQGDAFARLDHPCIASLLDRGVTERGIPFYTHPVAVVHTRPLFSLLHQKPPVLTLRERARILIDVSDALGVVHQAGFLHLQLTPFDIYLTRASQTFVRSGLHHSPPVFIATNASLDTTNHYFAAPEQLEILRQAGRGLTRYGADAFDARADVYALGGILHSLIYDISDKTGHRSLKYRTIQMRIAETWPLCQAASQDERLARELEPIWRWALAPEASNRLPNASAFAREVRQALWRAA